MVLSVAAIHGGQCGVNYGRSGISVSSGVTRKPASSRKYLDAL
jgi:hypothetical protein